MAETPEPLTDEEVIELMTKLDMIAYWEGEDLRELSKERLIEIITTLHGESERWHAAYARKSIEHIRSLAAIGSQHYEVTIHRAKPSKFDWKDFWHGVSGLRLRGLDANGD